MDFIDKQNDIGTLGDLVHYVFQAFLKFAAVFGACDHRGNIHSDNTLVFQHFRNIAVCDALGKSFNHSGFPDAWFADQTGVIFGSAREYLNDAFGFVFTADDRIQLSFFCQRSQIPTIV